MPASLLSPAQSAMAITSFIAGMVVEVLALLLYRQHRHRAMLLYAVFLGCALFVGGVSLLGMMRVQTPLWLSWIIGGMAVPVVAGLCISLPTFVLALLDLNPPRVVRWLIWLPAPTVLVGIGFQLAILPQGLPTLGRLTNQMASLGFAWFFLAWLGSCALLALRFRRITHPEVRRYVLGLALLMAVWIPFWQFEVWDQRLKLSPYAFALLWSGFSLYLAVRHFFRPLPLAQAAAPIEPLLPGPLADAGMLDRFAQAKGLTPRERELCGLLVEGLIHAAIAQRLFISEKTVRNHVSNIYAKVGASNRLELIQAIRGA